MENTKYTFDKKTNSYILTSTPPKNPKQILLYSLAFLASSALFGLMFSFVLHGKKSNAEEGIDYVAELEEMELQYEVINNKLAQAQQLLTEIENKDNNIYRTYFNMEEIPADIRKAGFGGTDRYSEFDGLKYGSLIKNVSQNVDILTKQLEIQAKSLEEVKKIAKSKEGNYSNLPAIQPVANKDLKRLASGYGMRFHPILKIHRMHKGIDFSAPTGTAVYATGDGKVKTSTHNGGYGNYIEIDHGDGFKTVYAHLSKTKVRSGQKVKRGDIIGNVGSTGMSTGPHLHYEIYKDGKPIDPIQYFYDDISPDEFKLLYEKSQQMSVSLD